MMLSSGIFKVKYLVLLTNLATTTTTLTAVENKIPNVTDLVKKKQIMMQRYQKLRTNILLPLIIINLRMLYLMQT